MDQTRTYITAANRNLAKLAVLRAQVDATFSRPMPMACEGQLSLFIEDAEANQDAHRAPLVIRLDEPDDEPCPYLCAHD
jgi:hypothetical protein